MSYSEDEKHKNLVRVLSGIEKELRIQNDILCTNLLLSSSSEAFKSEIITKEKFSDMIINIMKSMESMYSQK